MIELLFNNYELSIINIQAQQYDNLTDDVIIRGNFPDDMTSWEFYLAKGTYLDVVPLTATEGGYYHTLTATQLAFGGEYEIQVYGKNGNNVKHTNVVAFTIYSSLSGNAQWVTIPTAFTDLKAEIEALVGSITGLTAEASIDTEGEETSVDVTSSMVGTHINLDFEFHNLIQKVDGEEDNLTALDGEGNIVDSGIAKDDITDMQDDIDTLETAVQGKQDTLISGTNIKTVNGVSLLGSGNLPIASGVSSVNGKTGAVVLDYEDVGADAEGSASTVQGNLNTHTANTSNPHGVTKAQVGLGNADNTSDADKPISTATQTALNGKQSTIDSGHKLSADLIADGSTNIIPTSADKANWNGKQDEITQQNKLPYSLLSNTPTIPTKTSELQNDSGYLTQHQDISGKADKVANAVNGNFAGLDSNGNLTDSGKKPSDFLTEHQSLSAYRTASAQDLIDNGKADKKAIVKDTASTSITVTANGNTDYIYGELTALNLSFNNGTDDAEIDVMFKSGATATTLTVSTANAKFGSFTPSANAYVEINAKWYIDKWIVLFAEVSAV